jgi:uncharacterized protein (UPF0333 family)
MKQKHRGVRGQVSLEFLIVTSVVLLVLVVMGIVLYQKYVEYADLRLYVTGRNIANTVAENINQMSMVGDGYSESFTITPRYSGDEYNITFKKNEPTVFVSVQEMTWQAPLLTTEVYCCLPKICTNYADKVVLYLNNTLSTRVINYQKKVYIGVVC